jgi:pimeloyl-ACP methyl ester carboxylesterase
MLPILLVPGLNCSATLFANQIPHLWRFGSVMIANHTCGETVGTIARHILKSAPPQFTLVGFSMGGYIAFEILRQAPERVVRLALIDTGARADTAQQSERRRQRIAMAQSGRFSESLDPAEGPQTRAEVSSARRIITGKAVRMGFLDIRP